MILFIMTPATSINQLHLFNTALHLHLDQAISIVGDTSSGVVDPSYFHSTKTDTQNLITNIERATFALNDGDELTVTTTQVFPFDQDQCDALARQLCSSKIADTLTTEYFTALDKLFKFEAAITDRYPDYKTADVWKDSKDYFERIKNGLIRILRIIPGLQLEDGEIGNQAVKLIDKMKALRESGQFQFLAEKWGEIFNPPNPN